MQIAGEPLLASDQMRVRQAQLVRGVLHGLTGLGISEGQGQGNLAIGRTFRGEARGFRLPNG